MTTTIDTPFRIACPTCHRGFRVDPSKVPSEGGVHAICAGCWRVFFVEASAPEPAAGTPSAAPASLPDDEPSLREAGEVEAATDVGDREGGGETRAGSDEPGRTPEPDWSPFEDLGTVTHETTEPGDFSPDSQPGPSSPAAPSPFGRRDPHERARRLARVLVSDMITYHPERHERALQQGTLEEEFEDEVQKSWEEYVSQVGPELAQGHRYFQDALNELLARGRDVY